MKVENNIYSNIANRIAKSGTIQKTLRLADSNPALFQSVSVFALSTTLRPAAILAIPTNSEKAKKDSLYSASRSIATGLVDLGFALMVFIPLNKAIDVATRKLFSSNEGFYSRNKEACSAWKSIANRGAKVALLPIVAYLNFKYVKNIADIISKRKNDKQNSDKK